MNKSNYFAYSVMYHYVKESKTNQYKNFKFLDYNKFKSQINYFLKTFNILSLDDFIDLKETKKILKKPPLLLTFDDGYLDHYDYVYPYLLEKKIKGLFYPPARIIEKNFILDVNKIHFILSKVNDKKIILNEIKGYLKKNTTFIFDEFELKQINTKSRFDNKETILIKRLLQYFLPLKIRINLVTFLFKKFVNLNTTEVSSKLYMKRNHIVEMIKDGMHFGSHGYNHHWFNFIPYKEQEIEIKKSCTFLRSLNKKESALTICYPYGSYNKDTIKILKKYNFKLGFTSLPGKIKMFEKKNNLILPRFDTNDFF